MDDAVPTPKLFYMRLMHRCSYGNAPDYIKDSILSVSDVHNVYTKSRSFCSGDLYVPRPNREIFKQSFYNGPLVLNSLPGALKVLSCQHVFKKKCKMYVLNGNAQTSVS